MRLRSAYWSLKCSINYLFTYHAYPELNIAHTTNLVESFFRQMKAKSAPHQGLTDEHKMMFIKDFFAKRVKNKAIADSKMSTMASSSGN